MSNSKLVNYVNISPNSSNPRNAAIKKITIHHMAGNFTVEQCGKGFSASSRKASANYGIGTDGRVGMYVEERNRAWTSGSPDNDNQSITIEVANDDGPPSWHVSDAALAKLSDLCVDICKRNGILRLNFTGSANGTLTMHRYFQPTTCPGPYLANQFSSFASKVNARLNPSPIKVVVKKSVDEIAKEVIQGKWGSGKTRQNALIKVGYDYASVQNRINQLLNPPVPIKVVVKKTTDEIAHEVIQGKWGIGNTRKNALIKAGYNYSTIQNRINQLL